MCMNDMNKRYALKRINEYTMEMNDGRPRKDQVLLESLLLVITNERVAARRRYPRMA